MSYFNAPILPIARNSSELVIEVDSRNPFPPPPYELLGAVSDPVYQERMNKIIGYLKRYSWSLFERIYLTLAIIITIAVPWPVIFFVQKAFTDDIDTTNNDRTPGGAIIFTEDQVRKFYEARLASFGVLVGIILVTWGPYLITKFLTVRKLNVLLAGFTAADCSKERPAEVHLRWAVRSSSTFRQRAQVVITLPLSFRGVGVSTFHPNAYLPAYVAQPGMWQGVPIDEKRN
ncbi:hypothetical protein BT69DRAFT_1289990 [Atractiella rhizophila]|nr:hypothetical protein BT69DRAFT_1289990 [Atractiella rhizophila]